MGVGPKRARLELECPALAHLGREVAREAGLAQRVEVPAAPGVQDVRRGLRAEDGHELRTVANARLVVDLDPGPGPVGLELPRDLVPVGVHRLVAVDGLDADHDRLRAGAAGGHRRQAMHAVAALDVAPQDGGRGPCHEGLEGRRVEMPRGRQAGRRLEGLDAAPRPGPEVGVGRAAVDPGLPQEQLDRGELVAVEPQLGLDLCRRGRGGDDRRLRRARRLGRGGAASVDVRGPGGGRRGRGGLIPRQGRVGRRLPAHEIEARSRELGKGAVGELRDEGLEGLGVGALPDREPDQPLAHEALVLLGRGAGSVEARLGEVAVVEAPCGALFRRGVQRPDPLDQRRLDPPSEGLAARVARTEVDVLDEGLLDPGHLCAARQLEDGAAHAPQHGRHLQSRAVDPPQERGRVGAVPVGPVEGDGAWGGGEGDDGARRVGAAREAGAGHASAGQARSGAERLREGVVAASVEDHDRGLGRGAADLVEDLADQQGRPLQVLARAQADLGRQQVVRPLHLHPVARVEDQRDLGAARPEAERRELAAQRLQVGVDDDLHVEPHAVELRPDGLGVVPRIGERGQMRVVAVAHHQRDAGREGRRSEDQEEDEGDDKPRRPGPRGFRTAGAPIAEELEAHGHGISSLRLRADATRTAPTKHRLDHGTQHRVK